MPGKRMCVVGGDLEVLSSVVDNLPAVIYLGFKDWGIYFVGRQIKELTGYDPEDFTSGKVTWRYVVHPEDADLIRKLNKEIMSTEKKEGILRYRIMTRTGEVKWVEDRRKLIFAPDGSFSHVDGVLVDITEVMRLEDNLRRKERELERSEKRYRSLIENIELGITLIDTDHTILTANRTQAGFFDKDPAELIGKKCYREFERRESVCPGCPGIEAMRKKCKTEVIKESRKEDGEVFVVRIHAFPVLDEKGEPAGFIEVVEDITEKRRMEDTIRESEEKYRNAVEESLVGVYIIQDGLFRFVNRRFCEIFGYEREEIVDKLGPLDLTHPDDREMVRENIRKRLEGELDSIEYEFNVLRKDGSVIPVRVLGGRCLIKGQPAIVGTVLDMSREKELERQFLQSQKMEALGKLAGGIAHDLNNYLAAILGFAEIARLKCHHECEASEEISKSLDSIAKTCEKASGVISQILAFSRRQMARPKIIDVNETISGMEKMLRRLLEEDIELIFRLGDGGLKAKIDPVQLEQVLVNLVVNARDAMPGGGKVIIETGKKFIDDSRYGKRGALMPKGEYVMVAVSDTGIGIPRSIQDRIFDPFFTTKDRDKGTGLGLSTVYGIVKQNGGFIWVYSEPGQGATFKIYLPRVHGDTSQEVGEEERMNDLKGEGKVLLVEDNNEVRLTTKGMLETIGYTVETASHPDEALKIIREKGCFDLIITDVVLPDMTGHQLVERIKKTCGNVKVLFVSGYTDDVIASRGLLHDGINFLPKPYSVKELAAAVKRAIGKSGD